MQKFKKLISYCVAVAAVGITAFGAALMADAESVFYKKLALPTFTPLPVVFSAVWTFVYICFIILVAECLANPKLRRQAYLTIGVLLLNPAWVSVFFVAHVPYASLGISATILAVLGYQTSYFVKHTKREWALLIPITAWYIYLFFVNYGVVLMN